MRTIIAYIATGFLMFAPFAAAVAVANLVGNQERPPECSTGFLAIGAVFATFAVSIGLIREIERRGWFR